MQTRSFGGSKRRNKVSVGEPAEGSLLDGLLFRNSERNIIRRSLLTKRKYGLVGTCGRIITGGQLFRNALFVGAFRRAAALDCSSRSR